MSLLVLINACVGGTVGLERTVVPLVATQEFHLTCDTLILDQHVIYARPTHGERYGVGVARPRRACS